MKHVLLIFTFILIFTGCGNTGTTQKEESHKGLRVTASATEVMAGQNITITAQADTQIVIYNWWAELGTLKSEGAKTVWTAPSQAGTYNLVLAATDINGNISYKGVNIIVDAPDTKEEEKTPQVPSYSGAFGEIRTLIASETPVTYICVGDSTRAESHYGGEYLFYELQNNLRAYNVTSYLLARAGHEAKQFADGSISPTWRDAVDRIPNSGSTAIVDISLGINDYWNRGASGIKSDIKSAISKIRSVKPQTHFMLTMPDRVYNDEAMTNNLKNIYTELSNELHIPLNNVVDAVMPSQASTSYAWYRDDGFNVHLSQSGQHLVAQYILSNILP